MYCDQLSKIELYQKSMQRYDLQCYQNQDLLIQMAIGQLVNFEFGFAVCNLCTER